MNIAIVVSSPMTIKAFLYDQIKQLSQKHNVTVIANFANSDELKFTSEKIKIIQINIIRKISLIKDTKALFKLWRLFRNHDFDLVYSVTPKAGLLAMVAS